MELMEAAKRSLLIALAVVVIFPVLGFIVNLIVSRILSGILGIIDTSGAAYLVFANVLTFPGVIYHELSHALWAFLTGAKIKKICLYRIEAGRLGYVSYVPRGFKLMQCVQISVASCAPVFMGVLALLGLWQAFCSVGMTGPLKALLGYLMVSILVHMDMSLEDLRVYMKGVAGCFLIGFVISMAVLMIGIGG